MSTNSSDEMHQTEQEEEHITTFYLDEDGNPILTQKKEEGYMFNGIRVGQWIIYSSSGECIEKIDYDEQGEVLHRNLYQNDCLHGKCYHYFLNTYFVEEYKNGKKHGVFEHRNKSDQLLMQKFYVEDQIQGLATYFDPITSQVIQEKLYKDDVCIDYKSFNQNGKCQYASSIDIDDCSRQPQDTEWSYIETIYPEDENHPKTDDVPRTVKHIYFSDKCMKKFFFVIIDGNLVFDGDYEEYDKYENLQIKCTYSKGQKNGVCLDYTTPHEIMMIPYKDDVVDGLKITTTTSKVIMKEENFKNGVLHGSTREFSPFDQTIWSEVNYVDGIKHGRFVDIDRSCWKKEREGQYKNGQLDGPIIKYKFASQSIELESVYDEGRLCSFKKYKYDVVIEECEFYESGKLKTKALFQDNKLHGQYIKYWPDEVINEISHFKDGILDGSYKRFTPNNICIQEYEYKEGKPVNIWFERTDNGILKKTIWYNSEHVCTMDKEIFEEFEVTNYFDEIKRKDTYYPSTGLTQVEFFYPSGALNHKWTIRNNNLVHVVGDAYEYYENGQIKTKTHYIEGILQGETISFFEN